MDPALTETLKTRRGLLTIALNMEPPVRCGGCDYLPDGTRITLVSKVWRKDKELAELRQQLRDLNAKRLAKLEATSDEELAKHSDDEVFEFLDA